MKFYRSFFLLLFLGLFSAFTISGCGLAATPIPSATPAPSDTPTPTATAVPTATSTPLPPLAILLAPEGADPLLEETLQELIAEQAALVGLRFQIRPFLTPADVAQDVAYVVALPPVDNLAELVSAAPDTRFLAANVPNLSPAPNLTSFSGGDAPDQTGFLAGYIAALITPSSRMGVISVEDTEAGQAARTAFQNGAHYFCGLCRPLHPPFYVYPLYIGLPSTASEGEWRALADYMLDHAVEVVFVVPGAGGEVLLSYLSQLGLRIIGTTPPPPGTEGVWVASIRYDLLDVYLEQLPGLVAGESGIQGPLPVEITDINESILTTGKQRLAQQILSELQAGWIDTGAAPTPTPAP